MILGGLRAARKSLEEPWDLVGQMAYTKALDLGSWIYKYIYIYEFLDSILFKDRGI